MRDDEDNIRQYLPVLRRIIILVAVLTAIPVVMWTITAFVRSHVAPPRAPALQPMAIAPSNPPANTTVAAAADQPPTQPVNTAKAAPPGAPANAGTNDAGGAGGSAASAYAAPTATTPTFNTASVGRPSNPTQDDATPAATGSADVAASPADSAAPNKSPDSETQVAARPQESVWPTPPSEAADASLPGEPISGPVPLPRKRPTSFAMAGNVPLPEPRPEAAGAGAPESTPTPMDWLKKVFHSSAPAQPADSASDTARE